MAVKPLNEGGSFASETTLGTNTPSELGTSIVTVEKASSRLLPSAVTAALAQAGLDDKTLARAAQLVAKNFDLDPSYFWGTGTPRDPYTGGPLSLATFRRLTEDAKPSVLEAMAPTLFRAPGDPERVMERPWLTSMNAAKLSTVLREMGPVLAPYHIAAHEGVALAAEVLNRRVSGKAFAANLKTVLAWYAVDKNTLMKGRELDWIGLANIALEAAAAKRTLTSAMDVRAFLYPETAEQTKRGTRAEANAAASESYAMYGGGRGTDWLNVASDLTPVARAFLAGDFANPEVKKFLDEKFGNAEEIAKAREVLRKQALIEAARKAAEEGNLQVAGLTGGRGGVNIPDAEGLAEAKELLSRGSPDWAKGASVLEQEVIDSKTAFQRSFVGRAITDAAGVFLGLWEAVQLGIINTAALSVPLLEAVGQDAEAKQYQATYDYYRRRVKSGDGVFAAMGQKLGWHPAVGTSLDFLVSWYLDPTIIAGKSLTAYRTLKYAPGLVAKRTLVEAAVAKIPGFEEYVSKRVAARLAQQTEDFVASIGRFSSDNAEELAKALATGDPGAIREFVQKFGTHIETGNALDEALLQKAQRLVVSRAAAAKAAPVVSDTSIKEAEHLLQSLFGVKVRPGSLAEASWMTRASAESRAVAVADQMPTIQGRVYAQTESGLLLPEATAKDIVEDAIRRHVLNPGQLEVPYALRPIPGFGLSASVKNALRASDIVNDGVLAAPQRTLAQLFGLNPGNVLNLNDDPARWARLVAVRSGEFNPREVDSIVDAMNKAAIGGNPEVAVEKVVQSRIIDPVLKAEATRQSIPDNLLPVIREELDRSLGRWRQELFGVVEGKNVRTPLLETQRVNELVFPDVLQVKKFVRTFANAHADLIGSAPSWMQRYIAESSEAWAKYFTPVARFSMRVWKTIVVPRGGYVGRVVLLDEGLGRWFGTGFSLLERAASTNVDEAVTALLGAGTLSVGRAPGFRVISGAAGRAVAKPVEAVTDFLWQTDEFRFGDDVLRLEVPRTSIGYEPLANTVSRQSEVIEDVMRRASQVSKDLKFRGQWGIVEPKNPSYYPALSHALNNQIGQSIPGRLALEAVRDGKNVVETQNLLLAWARRNGKSYLAQMGWAAEDAEEWAALLSKMVHGYTVGSKEVAAIALERGVTDDILRKIPRDSLPNVHGPLLQEATFGNSAGNLKGLTEYWYDTFVRLPENTLNRQPYYRAWKRRAERAYYAMAETQYGKGGVPIAELKEAIDQASRDFALKQVKRIMFDFSENSRLGELLYGVFPFLQPYTEAFSVYGHILWHRNPALLGYANRVWDAGKASGFIQKDPQTGEWVIPTSWWSGASTVLNLVSGEKGFQVLTPVRSLNLFASSAVRLPDDFPLVGGASVPVPSLSPLALLAFQRAFKDTDSDALSSWLFAYGPNVQLVPTSMNKFLMATFPEMYDEGLLNSIAMDYLIDYQYRGVYQDLATKPSSDGQRWSSALEEQAYNDARNHMMAKAFLSFNGIGTSLIRWDWAPIRQEYFDLIEKYDGNTLKAREEFLKKYPEYSAMTVGKTEVGPQLGFVDEMNRIIPEATGLRLPATEYARRFLNSEAGKELVAGGFTPLIGALLLQADEAASGNDFSTYSQYLAQGLVKTKDLVEFIEDVEQVGIEGSNPKIVEEHESFWGAVITWNEYKRAQQEALRSQGFKEGDERFASLEREEDGFLLSLRDHFPASFKNYFKVEVSETDPSDVLRVSWRNSTNSSGEPDPVTLARIRQFASLPQIQGFAAVKGLNYYLPALDRIRAEMIEAGIDSIEDAGAKELGLDVEYQTVLDELKSNPDYAGADYIVNTFLRNVLTSEPTQGELTLRDWQRSKDPRYAEYSTFEGEYRTLTDQIDAVQTTAEKSQLYTRITALFSRQYQQNPEIIRTWWERKSYSERSQYQDGLITKYVGYMNLWDLHLLGLDVNATTAAQLQTVATQRSAVQLAEYQATLAGRDFDKKAAYEPIDRIERAFAAANPEYAQVLNAQRTWGYALNTSEYVQGDHRAAYLWRNVAALLKATQTYATARGLTGSVYGSQANKTEYLRRRAVLIAVVNAYKEQDSRFAAEWSYLEGQVSDPLINYFMPDYYFDYPLGPVSPRQAA